MSEVARPDMACRVWWEKLMVVVEKSVSSGRQPVPERCDREAS